MEVIREVERLTVYEAPRSWAGTADAIDDDEYPTNLIYTRSEQNGYAIIARVVFTGVDFSKRPGNYFAHTLVSDGLADNAPGLLPVELWNAPFWEARQGAETELPLLVGPLQRGSITREATDEFLAADRERPRLVGGLLAAADEAISDGQQVLIIDSDSAQVCLWIAAVSYLLGPAGRALTFTTYSHDPRRSRTHIVGTVTAAGPFRGEAMAGFRIFEPQRGLVPQATAGMPAAMLARIGVTEAPAVWDLAVTLGVPVGEPLAACLPILASAALLCGHWLDVPEFQAALDWLSSSGSTATEQQLGVAVRTALRDQPLELLARSRQSELVQLAVRADVTSSASAAASPLASEVECATVKAMLARFDKGQQLGEPTRLLTRRGQAAAVAGCAGRLPRLDAERAVDLLLWATSAAVPLPDDPVRRVGAAVVKALLDDAVPAHLAEAARNLPALREGLVASIAGLPAGSQRIALAGSFAQTLSTSDFARYPALGEEWLVHVAAEQLVDPADALKQVVELRRRSGRDPLLDDGLIQSLWPDGYWSAAEASAIVTWLTVDELKSDPVVRQCAELLTNIPRPTDADVAEWMSFIIQLSNQPREVLADSGLSAVLSLEPAITSLISLARQAKRLTKAEATVDGLLRLYDETPSSTTRRFLQLHLPPLIARYSELSEVLRHCPTGLFSEFVNFAKARLEEDPPHDKMLAAKVFVAMRQLGRQQGDRYALLEHDVLAPFVPYWNRRDRADVAFNAEKIKKNEGRAFRLWLSNFLGLRRLFGSRS